MGSNEIEKGNLIGLRHCDTGFSSEINRRIFAGLPATMLFAGTSLVTTLPAPTIAFSPMETLLRIVEPDPIDAPFRTKVFSTVQSASVCSSPDSAVARG